MHQPRFLIAISEARKPPQRDSLRGLAQAHHELTVRHRTGGKPPRPLRIKLDTSVDFS